MVTQNRQTDAEETMWPTNDEIATGERDHPPVGNSTRTRGLAASTLKARFECFVGAPARLDAPRVESAHDLDAAAR